MDNKHLNTEELHEKLDALREMEWEARINECSHIAKKCRSEIRSIERKLRRRS